MAIHGGSRCLDPDDLAALLHDRIEPASQRAMEEHVAACSQCRELLSALAQTEEPPRLATRATGDGPAEPGDDAALTATVPWGMPHPELAPGARVGRYVVVRRIGAGAMGVVYAAHDPELDRKVAL